MHYKQNSECTGDSSFCTCQSTHSRADIRLTLDAAMVQLMQYIRDVGAILLHCNIPLYEFT
jgi:hypothetical protein